MPSKLLTAAFLALSTGCSPVPPDTSTEKSLLIQVPGYETPSMVLYTNIGTDTCRTATEHAMEISAHSSEHKAFMDGYYESKIRLGREDFRVFFRQERLAKAPHDYAYILCSNQSTPISMYCSVNGAVQDSCYSTGYSWYKLSEIELLINEINKNAPHWSDT